MAVVEKTIDIIGDDAFCRIIASRVIPEGMPVDIYDEAVRSFRKNAMRGMKDIQSIHFPNATTCNTYAFYGCSNLKSVTMENCTRLEESVFQDTNALESVSLPKLTFIGNYCFSGGGSTPVLRTLEFPELQSIYDYGVSRRTALESFIAPKLSYIGNMAFIGCTALKQLDFPSAQTVSGKPFIDCSSLEVINFGPNIKSLAASFLANTPAGIVVNFPFEEGKFTGAPWGNENAIINYEVPYSGTVPMPT